MPQMRPSAPWHGPLARVIHQALARRLPTMTAMHTPSAHGSARLYAPRRTRLFAHIRLGRSWPLAHLHPGRSRFSIRRTAYPGHLHTGRSQLAKRATPRPYGFPRSTPDARYLFGTTLSSNQVHRNAKATRTRTPPAYPMAPTPRLLTTTPPRAEPPPMPRLKMPE